MGTVYFINNEGHVLCKKCTKCGIVKDLELFNRCKKSFAGRMSSCKECQKEYRTENAIKIKKQREEYRRVNKEKIQEENRRYYEDNADRIKEYRRVNQERQREYNLRYRLENPEKVKEIDARYKRENKEKIRKYGKKYRKRNPHIGRINELKRRARLKQLPNEFTTECEDRILDYFEESCSLTGETVDLHLDHVIPISTGHGGTVFENIIPLKPSLNSSKKDRNIFDWFADNRDRLGLDQRRFDELIEYLADINDMTTEEYEEYVRWCHDNPREVGSEREVTQ